MRDTKRGSAIETQPIDFDGRLTAEAIRLHDGALGTVTDDPGADAAGQQAPGDFEHRIVVRARNMALARPMIDAVAKIPARAERAQSF